MLRQTDELIENMDVKNKNYTVYSTDLNSLDTAVTTTGAKADQSSLKHKLYIGNRRQ